MGQITDDEVRALLAAHDPRPHCDQCGAWVSADDVDSNYFHRGCPMAALIGYQIPVGGRPDPLVLLDGKALACDYT